MNRKDKDIVSFISLNVNLYSCVKRGKIDDLVDDIKQFIKTKVISLDFNSDIEIEVDETTEQ